MRGQIQSKQMSQKSEDEIPKAFLAQRLTRHLALRTLQRLTCHLFCGHTVTPSDNSSHQDERDSPADYNNMIIPHVFWQCNTRQPSPVHAGAKTPLIRTSASTTGDSLSSSSLTGGGSGRERARIASSPRSEITTGGLNAGGSGCRASGQTQSHTLGISICPATSGTMT